MSDPTPGPQIGSWLEGVESGSISDSVSDSQTSQTQIPIDPFEAASYTNLVLNNQNCWLCPKCRQPRDDREDWYLRKRGYKEMPMGYTRPVPECYPKDSERQELLFFGNPSTVIKCQNESSTGLDGPACTFDRVMSDYFRKKDLETKSGVGTDPYLEVASCPRCAHTKEDVESSPELREYIEKESSASTSSNKLSCYSLMEDPWEGELRYIRPFICDGQEGVIRCASKQFGAGLAAGSKETPCSGSYGQRIVFSENEKQANGSFIRTERIWVPGDEDPNPASAPPSLPNPLEYESSSDGIPSVSDHGQFSSSS